MLERIREIIIEQLNLQGVDITEETSFKDDLGADSLDLFELVMAFEEEYGIEMPQDDLEGIDTVGDVIKLLKDNGIND
ncbi:MAG: acyl carrier protein [Lachnospiraceae bacterium]|nr:acyl carrier protein [Lachnospiraceae bacterium]